MSDNPHADLIAFITTERVKARQEAFEVAAAYGMLTKQPLIAA